MKTHDYYDLGTYSRPISTESPEAQIWFDRGLNWTYGFNHEEARRCFERAITADPDCAMAHWGLAYAYGPYINKEWKFYAQDELETKLPIMRDAAEKAASLAQDPVEKAMAEALQSRYQSDVPQPLEEMNGWNDDFAKAMAAVYAQFPEDRDVIAIYAEAMMNRTPWKLWNLATGEPAEGADTLTMLDVLDEGMSLSGPIQPAKSSDLAPAEPEGLAAHPGICHMMIHTLEMSQLPERALAAADGIRNLMPDCGHLQHMPGHIDVLCGNYLAAVEASERSIAADKKYLAQVGPFGQYTAAVCHDNHLMMYASMLMGRWQSAIEAADFIGELVSDEVLLKSTKAFQITLESYVSMRMHVFIRFGKWQEIVDEPMPHNAELYPVSTAMHHYAKAIAHATLGHFDAAETERQAFEATMARIPEDRHLFNNTSHTVLAIARQMMLGEVAYHQANYDVAFDHLREAVALNDGLFYTEPWAWMHPPRHALGALLLAQNHLQEARGVYEADLGFDDSVIRANQHHDNVWSLHGYVECLDKLGQAKLADEWRPKLEKALALADVPIKSSCACRKVDNDCCG